MTLQLGAQFNTDTEILKLVEDLSKKDLFNYLLRDTYKLPDNPDQYKRFKCKCVYYHDPNKIKSKGNEQRDIQKYIAKNCPFEIRVKLNEKTNKYEIKGFNLNHKHDLTEENYKQHINQRKITPQMETKIKQIFILLII